MNQTEHVLEQGKTLVRAIEALETVEPTAPLERVRVYSLVAVWLALKTASHWKGRSKQIGITATDSSLAPPLVCLSAF